jgi:hypothetical protein
MDTSCSDALTAIAIEDPGTLPQYMLLQGDNIWGWAGRVDVLGEFAGYQVVRWDTMTTTRIPTWRQADWLIKHPGAASGWKRAQTTDEYAADVLTAEAAEAVAAQARRVAAEAALAAAKVEQRAKVAAIGQRAAIVYHGSQTRAHGSGNILGWCDCDEDGCDSGVSLRVGEYIVEHVGLSSFSLAA